MPLHLFGNRRILGVKRGGGWGIRTPEAVTPTRFPSVRHRPLGESSGWLREEPEGSLPAAPRCRRDDLPVHSTAAPRVAPSRPTPLGRKRSKGNRALAGARGVLLVSAARARRPHARCVAPSADMGMGPRRCPGPQVPYWRGHRALPSISPGDVL